MIKSKKIKIIVASFFVISEFFVQMYYGAWSVKAEVKCEPLPFEVTNIKGSTLYFGVPEKDKKVETINLHILNISDETIRVTTGVSKGTKYFTGDHWQVIGSKKESKEFKITYYPEGGKQEGLLEVATESCPGKIQVFSLNGGEEKIFLDKDTHDFGEKKIDDKTLPTQSFTVTNRTSGVASVTYTLEGKDVTDFSLSFAGSPAKALPSKESSIARVTFDPKTEGSKAAVLKVVAKNQAGIVMLDKTVSVQGKGMVSDPKPEDTPPVVDTKPKDTPATPLPYKPLEEIPLVGKQTELTAYLRAIFQFGLGIIAIVSMLAIMIGGYLYMFSAGGKADKAKPMITNALLGLGLALVSWIIIYTINPDLIELKGFRTIPIKLDTNTFRSPSEKASLLCSVREASWKNTTGSIGTEAIMVFNLPLDCTEKSEEIVLKVEVMKHSLVLSDSSVATVNFAKSKKELVQTIRNGQPSFLWEAKWEIPNSVEGPGWFLDGDSLYFYVQGTTTIDGKDYNSARKESSNRLEALTPKTSMCSIKDVDWTPSPKKADIRGIEADFGIRINSQCWTEKDKDTGKKKFALKIEIYNREDGQDAHAKKVFEHVAELDDSFIKMPFVVPPVEGVEGTYLTKSPSAGHYFIYATIVYANDNNKGFTERVRSTQGQDLNVQ